MIAALAYIALVVSLAAWMTGGWWWTPIPRRRPGDKQLLALIRHTRKATR